MLVGRYSYKSCWIAAEEASENKENVGFLLSCQKKFTFDLYDYQTIF